MSSDASVPGFERARMLTLQEVAIPDQRCGLCLNCKLPRVRLPQVQLGVHALAGPWVQRVIQQPMCTFCQLAVMNSMLEAARPKK